MNAGELASMLDYERRISELEAEKERHEDELVRYAHAFAEWVAERDRLREAATRIQQIVDTQALDEGLWFIAETAAEAYLQQELRRLHATIEGKQPEGK